MLSEKNSIRLLCSLKQDYEGKMRMAGRIKATGHIFLCLILK